ncbi:MAG: aspartyl/asparaginyl beta-hydroxylase domain-containing protein [Rhodothermales bacterium]|nr:aspartyl/asparaginyl beta-hydroxylase domain-containing protein [Rhodothermales bacterium]
MDAPKTFQERKRQFLKDYGFKVINAIERVVKRYSLVGDHPFFDPDTFRWNALLEANWEAIRAELDQVLTMREELPRFQDISTDQTAITTDDKWRTFFIYGFGFKAEKNAARCPETTRLVEQVPGMTTAFFSILAPGKHIPAHRGVYAGVLRYHLGLKVPEPREQCRIRVEDGIRHWEEGRGLLFDDTYEHEVWNDTDGERVVLFMDVLRPLPPPLALLNRLIIKAVALSPYIQDAKKNQETWEQRLEAAVAS